LPKAKGAMSGEPGESLLRRYQAAVLGSKAPTVAGDELVEVSPVAAEDFLDGLGIAAEKREAGRLSGKRSAPSQAGRCGCAAFIRAAGRAETSPQRQQGDTYTSPRPG
jgi:hypothetical protein